MGAAVLQAAEETLPAGGVPPGPSLSLSRSPWDPLPPTPPYPRGAGISSPGAWPLSCGPGSDRGSESVCPKASASSMTCVRGSLQPSIPGLPLQGYTRMGLQLWFHATVWYWGDSGRERHQDAQRKDAPASDRRSRKNEATSSLKFVLGLHLQHMEVPRLEV